MLSTGNVFLTLENVTSQLVEGVTENDGLQQLDYYTFAGIGTIIGGVATAGALIYTMLQDKKTRLLEFVKDVDAEIAEHLKNDEILKTRDECVTHAYVYLEILDRIAFLLEKNKIPKLFSDYYKNFFNYGITMMLWYVYAWQDRHTLEENWPSLIEWFKKNRIEKKGLNPYPLTHLPSMAYKIIEILGDKDEINEIIEDVIMTGGLDPEMIKKLNFECKKKIDKEEKLEEEIEREEIRKEIMKVRWHDEEIKKLNESSMK